MHEKPNIQNIISELTFSIGYQPVKITVLAESGSSRQYFRIQTESISLIATYSTNIEENEAFLAFDQHFTDLGLNVPKILAVNAEKTCYLQSDLGNESLFDFVMQQANRKHIDSEVVKYYQQALRNLVRFQLEGHQGLDYSKAYPAPCFDRKAIMDDLNYFKYYFLKLNSEIEFNETRLGNDFEQLADFLENAPTNFFMYRDFQSRNIMIQNNDTYFIDFQGGRKGPLQYDVVSLLYQVKAQLPQDLRNTLIEFYLKELSQYLNIESIRFKDYLPAFVYLRLMQVLGAYGFRGLIQKKKHFLESIPFCLKELDMQLQTYPLNKNWKELNSVLQQLKLLSPKYPMADPISDDRLTVRINSFSYKKGIPDDKSGNGGGFVFDCRAIPNPGRLPEFKDKTGRDQEVADFLHPYPAVDAFESHCQQLACQSIDNYLERGFKNLMISFGCTGGQHRSVFFAQKTFDFLKSRYPQIHLMLNHIEQKITESND